MRLSRWRQRTGGPFTALATSVVIASSLATPSVAKEIKTATPIKHLVIIFGENESFDHYFATYPIAENSEGPFFTPSDDTPTVNGLFSRGLLKNNPNLF